MRCISKTSTRMKRRWQGCFMGLGMGHGIGRTALMGRDIAPMNSHSCGCNAKVLHVLLDSSRSLRNWNWTGVSVQQRRLGIILLVAFANSSDAIKPQPPKIKRFYYHCATRTMLNHNLSIWRFSSLSTDLNMNHPLPLSVFCLSTSRSFLL